MSPDQGTALYRYPLKAGYSAGFPAADGFGWCFLLPPDTDAPATIGCDGPHRGEQFGTDVGDAAPPGGWDASCIAYIKAATAMADPTDHGRLIVQMVAEKVNVTDTTMNRTTVA